MRFPLLRRLMQAVAGVALTAASRPPRGAPTPAVLDANSSTADGTSVVTGSVAAKAGVPVFLAVISHHATAAVQPTVAWTLGAGPAWNLVPDQTQTANAGTRRGSLFIALPTADVTDTLTISFGGDTQTAFAWIAFHVPGAPTASTVVQGPAPVNSGGGAVTSLAVTSLSAFEDPNNVAIAWFGRPANDDITPDADFAELEDRGAASTAVRIQVQWARNQQDCTATFASSQAMGGMIEVRAA